MNSKEEIVNELRGLSPVLLKLREKEILPRVPNGYFESLADMVIFETRNESSLLENMEKNKIEVPNGYFDSFADNILLKIKTEDKKIGRGTISAPQKNKVIRLFSRVAIAASFAGIIAFGILHWQKTELTVNDCGDGIACLTQEEIYNYMNTNSYDFDVQQVQETVQPVLEKSEPKIDIDKKDAAHYMEQNKNMMDIEDASTDIF